MPAAPPNIVGNISAPPWWADPLKYVFATLVGALISFFSARFVTERNISASAKLQLKQFAREDVAALVQVRDLIDDALSAAEFVSSEGAFGRESWEVREQRFRGLVTDERFARAFSSPGRYHYFLRAVSLTERIIGTVVGWQAKLPTVDEWIEEVQEHGWGRRVFAREVSRKRWRAWLAVWEREDISTYMGEHLVPTLRAARYVVEWELQVRGVLKPLEEEARKVGALVIPGRDAIAFLGYGIDQDELGRWSQF